MNKLLLTIIITSLVATGCFLKKQPEVDRGAVIPLNREETAERFGNKTDNLDERVETEDIDTSDWKTYRNEEYGFEFQYPSNWVVQDKNGFISAVNPNSKWPSQESVEFTISKFDGSIENFIEDYNNSDISPDGSSLALIKENKLMEVNGIKGIKLVGTTALGIDQSYFFGEIRDRIFIFSFIDSNNFHNAILSSLKSSLSLLNNQGDIDTSDWKTYRNEEYGFEFQYPRNWTVDLIEQSRWGVMPMDKEGYQYIGDIVINRSESYMGVVEYYSGKDFNPFQIVDFEQIDIGEKSVYFSQQFPGMVSSENYIFKIEQQIFDISVYNNQTNIARKIINSFELID